MIRISNHPATFTTVAPGITVNAQIDYSIHKWEHNLGQKEARQMNTLPTAPSKKAVIGFDVLHIDDSTEVHAWLVAREYAHRADAAIYSTTTRAQAADHVSEDDLVEGIIRECTLVAQRHGYAEIAVREYTDDRWHVVSAISIAAT